MLVWVCRESLLNFPDNYSDSYWNYSHAKLWFHNKTTHCVTTSKCYRKWIWLIDLPTIPFSISELLTAKLWTINTSSIFIISRTIMVSHQWMLLIHYHQSMFIYFSISASKNLTFFDMALLLFGWTIPYAVAFPGFAASWQH